MAQVSEKDCPVGHRLSCATVVLEPPSGDEEKLFPISRVV